jgi:hypothetical protein
MGDFLGGFLGGIFGIQVIRRRYLEIGERW